MKKIDHICLALRPKISPSYLGVVKKIAEWLFKKNVYLIFPQAQKTIIQKLLPSKKILFSNPKNFFKQGDLIISLGGDGTFIGLCPFSNEKTPVLSINLGTVGFITEFEKDQMFDALENIFKKKAVLKKIPLFSIEIKRKNPIKDYFINDVVMSKNDIARIFSLRLQVNDEPFYSLSGDGIIISSPIGSTAYSLAAGGPIVHPDVSGIILTPICTHSLIHRPVVIPNSSFVKLNAFNKASGVHITLDGQKNIPLNPDDTVVINKTKPKKVVIIKNQTLSYPSKLQKKFIHGRKELG